MKNHLLVLTLSLFIIAAFAQKKKKQKTPPEIEKTAVPPTVVEESSRTRNDVEYLLVPESSLSQINATKANGQEINIKDVKELETINLSQLKKLNINTRVSGKSLDATILQKIITEATQLEVLEIDNYTIDSFPEIKTPNHYLKRLSLNKNNLKVLPSSISNLVALEDFSSGNPLQELPETFSQLKNLKELGLNYIEFSEFPKAIFSLQKLSVLYISGNYKENTKLKEIPDLFVQLPNLKEFGVESASLSSLPKSISTLKKLETVNFSDNQFIDFPEALASNTKLVYVSFSNNPFDWDKFLVSIKKIKWSGLFSLYETKFTKKQYKEVQKILSKTDVYYEGMND